MNNYAIIFHKNIYLSLVLIAGILFLNACQSNQQKTEQSKKKDAMKPKAGITATEFGKMPDGKVAMLYTLRNTQEMEVKITNYGGIITEWTAPDKTGKYENIVLGYDNLANYLKGSPYFGCIVGRYGNRIAKGKFILEGKTYTLAINNIGNHLHGGEKGFDKVFWIAKTIKAEEPVLRLTYLSKDGEEGYPGNLRIEVTYSLREDNSLQIDYQATTDKTTIINLTNHSYFNLLGNIKSDILNHKLMLNADKFLPVDNTLIPTGEQKSVQGTVFDFTTSTAIGERINDKNDQQIKFGLGYDHCWVLKAGRDSLNFAARVLEPQSGRVLEVWTTEPAVQFYSGNFLDGTLKSKNGIVFNHRYGFCLETQHYPDSPNQKEFPRTVLKPKQTYKTRTIYKFFVQK